MVPRGCCHDLIDLTLEPVAIVWSYAGAALEATVVDEPLCHPAATLGKRSARRRREWTGTC